MVERWDGVSSIDMGHAISGGCEEVDPAFVSCLAVAHWIGK